MLDCFTLRRATASTAGTKQKELPQAAPKPTLKKTDPGPKQEELVHEEEEDTETGQWFMDAFEDTVSPITVLTVCLICHNDVIFICRMKSAQLCLFLKFNSMPVQY